MKYFKKFRGNKGFGFDSIFIPNGYSETFGENPDLSDKLSPFNETIKKVFRHLEK